MSIEAMKQALEALTIWEQMYPTSTASAYRLPAITSLRQAIAEAEQEPVAWMHKQGNHEEPSFRQLDNWEIGNGWTQYPLYTHPPQRSEDTQTKHAVLETHKPLTEEQIATISVECATVSPSDIYFARAIEAAHGIKGEA